jgi:hypothetical protein
MKEKIKTNEEKNSERLAVDKLSEDVSRLVKDNPAETKNLYEDYHEHPLAISYDLAVAEDEHREALKQGAQAEDGAFFAAQDIDRMASQQTEANFEALRKSYLKNEAWFEKNEALDLIEAGFRAGKSLQQVIDETYAPEKLAEAFKEREASFACSDGRVKIDGSDFNKLGMAGGGILLFPRQSDESKEQWLDRLRDDAKFDHLITELHRLRVKEVVSHEECGAARHVSGRERGDDDGAILAQYIHFRLQNFDKSAFDPSIAYRHLTLDGDENGENKMRKEIHDERMLLVDTTGRFNPDSLGLPSNFMVSSFRLGVTKEDVEKELAFEVGDLGDRINEELKLLLGVADKHGFRGKRFTEEKPFYIFVVADSQEHLDALRKCAEQVAGHVPDLPIKVDGFVRQVEENT